MLLLDLIYNILLVKYRLVVIFRIVLTEMPVWNFVFIPKDFFIKEFLKGANVKT